MNMWWTLLTRNPCMALHMQHLAALLYVWLREACERGLWRLGRVQINTSHVKRSETKLKGIAKYGATVHSGLRKETHLDCKSFFMRRCVYI